MEKVYLSCADTAKLVRTQLKKNFPGIKFSVRSDTYSGGASIDIRWEMGPTTKEVDEIASMYESSSFDGSIDMACHYDHWLLPDGTACVESTSGTEGSRGYIPRIEGTERPEGARLVSFGANYINTSREIPTDIFERIGKDMCSLQKVEYQGINTPELFGSGDTRYLSNHIHRLMSEVSFKPNEKYAGVRFKTKEELEADYTAEVFTVIKARV